MPDYPLKTMLIGVVFLVGVALLAGCSDAKPQPEQDSHDVDVGAAAVIHGPGSAATTSLQQAGLSAWLCEKQLQAVEQDVPRIPPDDASLKSQADRAISWMKSGCPTSHGATFPDVDALLKQLDALPAPTPVIPQVSSIRAATASQ